MTIRKTTVMITIFTAFSSCENYVEEYEKITEQDCDPQISFMNEINPIIEKSCTSCHNGSQFPDLRTYSIIRDNSKIIKDQVVIRAMPIGGSLSTEEIELISCWVDSGSSNN